MKFYHSHKIFNDLNKNNNNNNNKLFNYKISNFFDTENETIS